jgi:hypothetical protein
MVKTGFNEFNIYGPLLNICWHLKHRSREHLLTGKAKYGVPPRTSKGQYYKHYGLVIYGEMTAYI